MQITVQANNDDLLKTKHATEFLAAVKTTGFRPPYTDISQIVRAPVSSVFDVWRRIERDFDVTVTVTLQRKKGATGGAAWQTSKK